ncbi:MAG TPA: polysaccharide deacetylase family protein [Cyclobacteriaceae bacterium]
MIRNITIFFLLVFSSCAPEKKPADEKVKSNEKANETILFSKEKEIVTFVYHRFGDDRFPSTNITVTNFELHLQWLSANHYQVLSLSDALHYLQNDSMTRKTAVITIDDGYKSFYANGFPLLKKYKMPATLFINTETVGARDYMSWRELEQLTINGIEIGNHTHSHAYFLNQKQNERYTAFLNEIELSQKLIEEHLRLKPKVFAYPYGEFDDGFETIVKATGFIGAAAQNSGVINRSTNVFQLPRFPMSEAYTDKFVEKAQMESLHIIQSAPALPTVPRGKSRPILTLTIDPKGLRTDQLQCFVQNSSCKLRIVKQSPTELKMTMQATTSILKSRRTLYTLTAPDSSGNWHWYSHLWINPSIK